MNTCLGKRMLKWYKEMRHNCNSIYTRMKKEDRSKD